ncbi:MAG: carboxymuconolactone decarboxylase family protein [Pseudomonadota bacterium]
MARIPYPAAEDLPAETAELLGKLAPLNIFKMMAHAGPQLRPFTQLGGAFLQKGELDPVLREVVILRVGYVSGARYETHQHEAIGRALGMDAALFEAIKAGPGAPGLEPLHDLALAFTDDVIANVRATDAAFLPILEALGPAGAQEMTLLVGYYMMVCRFLETFGVDIEDGDGGIAAGLIDAEPK